MAKRQIVLVGMAIVLLGGLAVGRRYLPAFWTPLGPPPADITELLPPEDSTRPSEPSGAGDRPSAGSEETPAHDAGRPLTLPPGFSISIFAKDLPGARVMRFDQFGNLWVSRTGEGAVTLLEIDRDTGAVRNQGDVFTGLRKPHGLAFDPQHPGLLYIAEEHRVWRVATYSEDRGEKVVDLPAGEGHFTRTIGFGPDKRLYISVGSSCNVCRESDERRAAILRYDPASATAAAGRPETRPSEVFARGLRNAVFFVWDAAGSMWATEMGRDWLGDDLPPDEINVVEEGRDYGWPDCYGKNVRDPFGLERTNDPCAGKAPSTIDIPAHSAPLGLAFIPPNSAWPEEYWHDLFVTYHGSWNRSQPTGYKVVRHAFDATGAYQGVEDFITGWLAPDGALGRPVDILIRLDGTMYLSDDKAGVIYKVRWRGTK